MKIDKDIRLKALIYYGAKAFDGSIFQKITNQDWVKPNGGLWTSPVNSKFGWKDWCEEEKFRECEKSESFQIILNEKANIYIIDSLVDLILCPGLLPRPGLPREYGDYVDFEKMVELGYDAIWLTEIGQYATRYSKPSLYGWDCETVLILKTDNLIAI